MSNRLVRVEMLGHCQHCEHVPARRGETNQRALDMQQVFALILCSLLEHPTRRRRDAHHDAVRPIARRIELNFAHAIIKIARAASIQHAEGFAPAVNFYGTGKTRLGCFLQNKPRVTRTTAVPRQCEGAAQVRIVNRRARCPHHSQTSSAARSFFRACRSSKNFPTAVRACVESRRADCTLASATIRDACGSDDSGDTTSGRVPGTQPR